MYTELALDAGGHLWSSSGGEAARIPADGCVDVILHDGTVMIAGPSTRWIQTRRDGDQPTIGVRLPPGSAAGVLGGALAELRDGQAELADIVSASTNRSTRESLLRQSGAGGSEPVAPVPVLGEWMSPTPGWTTVVRRGARANQSVIALTRELGYSERELRRRMRSAFGYGYRSLVRIERAHRARTLIGQGFPLADVATAAGYADQSHLSRDFVHLVGMTPGQFASSAA